MKTSTPTINRKNGKIIGVGMLMRPGATEEAKSTHTLRHRGDERDSAASHALAQLIEQRKRDGIAAEEDETKGRRHVLTTGWELGKHLSDASMEWTATQGDCDRSGPKFTTGGFVASPFDTSAMPIVTTFASGTANRYRDADEARIGSNVSKLIINIPGMTSEAAVIEIRK